MQQHHHRPIVSQICDYWLISWSLTLNFYVISSRMYSLILKNSMKLS